MHESPLAPAPYFVKPGYAITNPSAMLLRCVLGNGVAVTLYDQVRRFGGMHHFIFPGTLRAEDATAQYGNIGLPALIRAMRPPGSGEGALVAQILGGASLPGWADGDLGRRNVAAARKILARWRVPVISSDTGGRLGRKVVYHSGTNQTGVLRAGDLRRSDWFRPGMDLRFCGPGRG